MMQNVKVHKTMAVPIGTLYTGSNFVDLRAYCGAWWVGGGVFFWGGGVTYRCFRIYVPRRYNVNPIVQIILLAYLNMKGPLNQIRSLSSSSSLTPWEPPWDLNIPRGTSYLDLLSIIPYVVYLEINLIRTFKRTISSIGQLLNYGDPTLYICIPVYI